VPVHTGASYATFSVELEQDAVDLIAQLSELMTAGKAEVETQKFWNGTGTDEPRGLGTALAAATGTHVSTTTGATYAIGDTYKLQEALGGAYQDGASWLASLPVRNLTRRFAEASDGSAFWSNLAGGVPPRLLGHPFRVLSPMDSTVATGKYLLAYGDYSKSFIIVDRVGATVERVDQVLGANRRPILAHGLVFWYRNGSDLINTNGVKTLVA
jgi:HK97 family phage major capsid protein